MDKDDQTVPPGWVVTTIDDVTLPVAKIDPRGNPDTLISYIDISSIDNIRNAVTEAKQMSLGEAPSRARQLIQSGDVLFSTVRPYLRNIASVPDRYDGEVASTGFSVLRPASGIEPKFLFFKCVSHDFVSSLTVEQYGVSYPAVKDEQVRSRPLLLPPEREQNRIVAKVEELFSELDKGVENLTTAREQLKVYRQAMLKHAFEGKLTAQWRKENEDELKTADQLLANIKLEREIAYRRRLADWESGERVNGGRPRIPKVLSALKSDEIQQLPDLPQQWCWARLGLMTCGVEYGTAAKSSKSGKVPVIRMGNIQNAKLDWSDLVYTSGEAEIRKYALQEGDVLFNRTNSPELVGKTAIYRGERPALFAGYLIRVNQISAIADSQYLNLFLNSHLARHHGNSVKTDGVNQSNINGEKLSNYPFPYCSLAEQQEIVRVLDEKLSLVDQIEREIEQQLRKSNALRHSILKMALSGQLVAQDPNDEPASVLLERIKAEKETNNKKTGRKAAA